MHKILEHKILGEGYADMTELGQQVFSNSTPVQEHSRELALAATDDHVADEEAVVREIDEQGAIIQGEYSDVDDIFFQRPEDE